MKGLDELLLFADAQTQVTARDLRELVESNEVSERLAKYYWR